MMIKTIYQVSLGFIVIGLINPLSAATCPNPNESSLQWGEIPPPWQANPFSRQKPQGELNTAFVSASILVAGLGQGVVCTYHNLLGNYSIWWPVRVKIPAPQDYKWLSNVGGYTCSDSLLVCCFTTG
jgi:hypothetical protein